MELVQGRHKPFKFAPEDVISNMPDIVITNILDRLPLQDTVRTGVLSRNWRFKWTMISKLTIDEEFIEYLSKTRSKNNHVRIISRILLHLRGDITTFLLSIEANLLDVEDINHWILLFSSKGIKDLTLKNMGRTPLKLSAHLFSCLELKYLKLWNCCFDPPHGFHGFPNLLSLELYHVKIGSSNPCAFHWFPNLLSLKLYGVQIESNDLWEFFTWCPLLESLNLHYFSSTREVKLVEIPKLENLKILSCNLDAIMITNINTIFELLGSLPKLQELDLDLFEHEVTEGDTKKRFPTSLPCLKSLKLFIDVASDKNLSCAFELVRSFPNLPFLEITTMKRRDNDSTPTICSFEEDYSTMGRLQLQNIVFTSFCDAPEKDICVIKYLLACSPILKKLVIHFLKFLDLDEKLIFVRKVLKLQRAYPAVDIDLH